MGRRAGLGIMVFVCCLAATVVLGAASRTFAQLRVGGPCKYKKYKGKAEIVSVTQRPGASGDYEVKFSFHPEGPIQEPFAKVEGKKWDLSSGGSTHLDADFLSKYGVGTGKSFDCYMDVITRGVCTPVRFEFPSIGQD